MKNLVLGLIIAVMLAPSVSHAMTPEQRLETLTQIEILMKRILILQDLLIELREAELAEKKAEFESLKESSQIQEMPKEKTFKVTSPEGGAVEVNRKMSLEEMREFVISLNRDHIKFRKQMQEASEGELVEFLKNNGYTVK
jgi:hypothetical protein